MIPGVTVPVERPNCAHVFHLFVIQHEQRDSLKAHLQKLGIGTVLNYPKALPFYAAYGYLGHTAADFPTAYHHQSRILSLPIFPFMRDEELAYVVDSIRSFS